MRRKLKNTIAIDKEITVNPIKKVDKQQKKIEPVRETKDPFDILQFNDWNLLVDDFDQF